MIVLKAKRYDHLPALAWLVKLEGSEATAHVGEGVELFEDGLFEGAWAGNFAEASFGSARTVAGSGVERQRDSLFFVPPSHTLEGLYYHLGGKHAYVSNSLAFLLSVARPRLKYDRRVGERASSIVKGLRAYDRTVLETEEGPIGRIVYHNFRLSPTGELTIEPKLTDFAFDTFADWLSLLEGETSRLVTNADHPERRQTFTPITMCSSGYDSAAGAVIAAEFGCREAITLANSRSGQDDSGRTAAEVLGLRLHELERVRDAKGDDSLIAEFLVAGTGGEDFIHKSFESVLHGRLLFSGFQGGALWDKVLKPKPDLERKDVSGASLGEFRLRVGFCHFPVPFVGALEHERLFAVSNAEDMRPFSVGGDYDRPIPRRLLEEAGVPREAFGRRKNMASILIHAEPSLLPESYLAKVKEAERSYFPGVSLLRYKAHEADFWVRYFLARAFNKLSRQIRPARAPLQALVKLLSRDLRTFQHNNPRTFFDIVTSAAILEERYRLEPESPVQLQGG